jgi:hypothetical protein
VSVLQANGQSSGRVDEAACSPQAPLTSWSSNYQRRVWRGFSPHGAYSSAETSLRLLPLCACDQRWPRARQVPGAHERCTENASSEIIARKWVEHETKRFGTLGLELLGRVVAMLTWLCRYRSRRRRRQRSQACAYCWFPQPRDSARGADRGSNRAVPRGLPVTSAASTTGERCAPVDRAAAIDRPLSAGCPA